MADDGDRSVSDYLASLDDQQTVDDSVTLIEMMQRISGKEPTALERGHVGFGTYHYRYDSGREGDGHTIGFYPRKGKLTIYVMDGTARHAELLARLGKHSTTGYCVYIRRLGDVDPTVLEQSSATPSTSSRRRRRTGRSERSCGKPKGSRRAGVRADHQSSALAFEARLGFLLDQHGDEVAHLR